MGKNNIRLRMRFTKYGTMKYVGHLDMMRYFMNAIRRAGLPIKYTEGFHPHPILSFALPLGVGVTSGGEYMDMELAMDAAPEDAEVSAMLELLQRQMVEGVSIVSARLLSPEEKNAMAAVEAASYFVYPREDAFGLSFDALQDAFVRFCREPSMPVIKKTKKGEREVDVAPFCYHLSLHRLGFPQPLPYVLMLLSAGSNDNIKPELVMDGFCAYLSRPGIQTGYGIHRFDLFTRSGDAFVSLGEHYDKR